MYCIRVCRQGARCHATAHMPLHKRRPLAGGRAPGHNVIRRRSGPSSPPPPFKGVSVSPRGRDATGYHTWPEARLYHTYGGWMASSTRAPRCATTQATFSHQPPRIVSNDSLPMEPRSLKYVYLLQYAMPVSLIGVMMVAMRAQNNV